MNSIGNAASIWTPFTYWDAQQPHYRIALGVVIALMSVAGISGTILRFYLAAQNKRFERMEQEDTELRASDLKKLEKTAEMEGTDLAHARQLQKGFRYQL
jgi:Tfp pilus assembly protein PilO